MTRVPAASPLGTLYVEAKRTAAVEIGLTVSENEVRDFLKRRLRDVRIGTQIQPDAGEYTPILNSTALNHCRNTLSRNYRANLIYGIQQEQRNPRHNMLPAGGK
jgi:hypothetical protein